MSDPLLGRRLGDFDVLELLGQGAMARVYRALQVSPKRPVALKVFQEGLLPYGELAERFLREAEYLAQFEHPNILPVYAAGRADGFSYIAMRLVRDGTLGEWLRSPRPACEVVSLLSDVASALARVHARGGVHRDLKPTNVLVDGRSAFLADFGLARLAEDSTLTGTHAFLGTIRYMSPEQLERRPATPASDVFSFGVVLFEALAGVHPFPEAPVHEGPVARLAALANLPAPVLGRADLPPGIDRVIARCLQLLPEARYADAAALHDDLVSIPWPSEASLGAPAASPQAAVPTVVLASSSSRPPDPSTATMLTRAFGRYVLRGELGHGGMGVVYRAWDPSLDREVALKVVKAGELAEPAQVERFDREARLAARLRHPGIVPVHEVGVLEGRHYFTMDLIEGRSLKEILVERTTPLGQVVRLLAQVARAVDHAHRNGVVHRDLKPQNVLVEGLDRALVADFGLARDVKWEGAQQATVSGQIMGTPAYMAPEQARGERGAVDARSDVWALGAILYEALAGRPPFQGESPFEVISQVLSDDPTPPRRMDPAAPRDLEVVCLKALEKDAARRYASAADLADDLDRFLAGEPIHARPVSALGRLVRTAGRHRRAVLAVAVAVLGAATVWGAGAIERRREVARLIEAATGAEREAEGLGTSEAGRRLKDAQDAFNRVLGMDRDHAAAAVGLERVKARLAALETRTWEDAHRVSRVLSRWSRLAAAIEDLERTCYDDRLSSAEKLDRAEPRWREVRSFLDATPEDAVSRATALALAGWARRLAGAEKEADGMLEEASRLAPDVPYGRLQTALVLLARYLADQELGNVRYGPRGVEVSAAPSEDAARTPLRERAEALLEEASSARLWGKETAEDFGSVIEGIRAMHRGEYAAASAAFTRAIDSPDLRPFRTTLLFFRSRTRLLGREYDAALADTDEALVVREGSGALHIQRGFLRLTQAADDRPKGAGTRAMLAAAIGDFDRALEVCPGRPQALVDRAMALCELADLEERTGVDARPRYESAVEDVELVLAASPERYELYVDLGLALLRLAEIERDRGGDAMPLLDRSLARLGQALEARPGFYEALVDRALVHLRRGDIEGACGADPRASYARAIEDADAALAQAPGKPEALVQRGQAFLRAGEAAVRYGEDPREKLTRAVKDLQEGAEGSPDFAEAFSNLALARRALAAASGGDPREAYHAALADLDRAIEIDDSMYMAWNNRGLLLDDLARQESARGGDARRWLEKAIEAYDGATQRNQAYAPAWYNRGNARLLLAQEAERRGESYEAILREAISDYGGALVRNASHVLALVGRGEARRQLAEAAARRGEDPESMLDEALADFDAAIERQPGNATARYNRGLARRQRADAAARKGEDARGWLRGAIEDLGVAGEGGRDPQALAWRAAAQRRMGEEEARRGGDAGPWLEKAVADASAAIKADASLAEGWFQRGTARVQIAGMAAEAGKDSRPDLDPAVGDLEEAVRLDSRHASALGNLGTALYRYASEDSARGGDSRGHLKRAIEAYTRAEGLGADAASVRSSRGRACHELGLAEKAAGGDGGEWLRKARTDYEALLAAGRGDWTVRAALGSVHEELGDVARAVREYEEALRAAGQDVPELRARLDAARKRLGVERR